ncbi:hypothetical protein ACHAPT_001415 [Fusarium lateritium]
MLPGFFSMYEAFIADFNPFPFGGMDFPSWAPPRNMRPSSRVPHSNSYATRQVPRGNSHVPSQKSPTEVLLAYYKNLRKQAPPRAPPSWSQAGSWPKLWRVVFTFGQDIYKLRDETPLNQLTGWTACLDLVTCDLPAMMRDGLFLTWQNVRVGENHAKMTYTEGLGDLCNRCYTVADSTWSGNLNVCAWTTEGVANFRIHHLSADKVFYVSVGNQKGERVYFYDVRDPKNNANFMYDDMPLEGLWPWPKKARGPKDEKVVKDEGGDGVREKEAERQEAEPKETEEEKTEEREKDLRCFSPWQSEDSLIDLDGDWQDANDVP